jgi:putative transposase
MPRSPRINVPGMVYHVINRGVKQLAIFHDDEDRLEFLDWLKEMRHKYPVEIHQYSLMTNHYHLLMRPLESLSRMMQFFSSRFAAWFNKKYRHSGHLFQGRFHSIPVEQDSYYTTVSRYIHLNAVRAGIVLRPEHYRWSNYGSLIEGR